MTTADTEAALGARGCAIVEDGGLFALVYPSGFESGKRAHDLAATTRASALAEAWDWLHPEKKQSGDIETIARVVAGDFGVTLDKLLRGGRPEPLATARRMALALARDLTPVSSTFLARIYGKDHATVLYAQASIAEQCSIDEVFAARVGSVRALCARALAGAKGGGVSALAHADRICGETRSASFIHPEKPLGRLVL